MSASEWVKTRLILGYEYNADDDCVIMRKKTGKVAMMFPGIEDGEIKTIYF
jgi:hypothetical protein